MGTSVWGPPLWKEMHAKTFEYNPSKNREEIVDYFIEVIERIPCPECREHYKDHLPSIQFHLGSRDELVYWLIDFHNSVNARLGKPILHRDTAYNMHRPANKFNMFLIVLILLLILGWGMCKLI